MRSPTREPQKMTSEDDLIRQLAAPLESRIHWAMRSALYPGMATSIGSVHHPKPPRISVKHRRFRDTEKTARVEAMYAGRGIPNTRQNRPRLVSGLQDARTHRLLR